MNAKQRKARHKRRQSAGSKPPIEAPLYTDERHVHARTDAYTAGHSPLFKRGGSMVVVTTADRESDLGRPRTLAARVRSLLNRKASQ